MGRGIVLVLSIGLAALLSGSCGPGGPGGTDPAVTAVSVTPESASIDVGETVQLDAVATPAEAPQGVKWSSSDEDVASVSDEGLVLGKAEGIAEITARSTANASKSGSATVEVSYAPVTGVTIAPPAAELLVGESVGFSATVQPANANPAVTWSSSNEGVALVSTAGLVTAVGSGAAQITATSVQDPSFLHTVSVAVVFDPTDRVDCGDATPLSSDITVATTLPLACYHVARVVDVSAPLTVQPGTVFQFDSWAGLRITAMGSLRAPGTDRFPITFTSRSGATNAWYGMGIFSDSPENLLEHVVIEKAGQRSWVNGNYATAVYLGQDAGIAITDSLFREVGDNGVGLAVHGRTSRLHAFERNAFDSNEGAAMDVTSHQLGAIGEGNVFDLEGRALQVAKHIAVRYDEPLRTSATWPAVDVPYRFSTTHFINEGSAVITIAAGARLEFTTWAGLAVQAGALRVEGQSGAPVTFTSASGVTNDWYGLGILSPSDQNLLRHAVIENAGKTHGTINGHNSTNLYLGPTGRASITNSTFRTAGNNGYGIYLSHATSRLATFTNNTFDANQGPPMRITSHQPGALGTGNVFGLNAPGTVRYVRVDADGPILASATWPAVDVPYRFFSNHFIDKDDAVITILPGANLTFDRFTGLRVNAGALRAIGTAAEGGRITFGRAVADEGWYGVGFATVNDANELRYVTIAGASRGHSGIDGSASTNLYVSSIGRVKVTHSAFNDAVYGIYIENGGVVTDQNGEPINPGTHGSNTFSGNTTNVRSP